jgi:ketosteroid isomerase-like protein
MRAFAAVARPVAAALVTVAVVLVAAPAAPARAAETEDVMTTVIHFVEAFNQGDAKAAAATCADDMAILDEFPPFEWHGPGAIGTWFKAYDADAKKSGITAGIVTVGEARHLDLAGDRAYVVADANYAYKKKGVAIKEVGSTFTVTLHKTAAGWRITGWAWAKK